MKKIVWLLIGLNILVSCNSRTDKDVKSSDSIIEANQTADTDNIWNHIDQKGEWFKMDSKVYLNH